MTRLVILTLSLASNFLFANPYPLDHSLYEGDCNQAKSRIKDLGFKIEMPWPSNINRFIRRSFDKEETILFACLPNRPDDMTYSIKQSNSDIAYYHLKSILIKRYGTPIKEDQKGLFWGLPNPIGLKQIKDSNRVYTIVYSSPYEINN